MKNALLESGTCMREPLLHFIVLGAALFGVDHLFASDVDNRRTVAVDASVDQRAREAFRQQHGRDPSAEELHSLRRPWLDNEVLYREGIALQLDKGDPAIRDRVIFKMLNLIEAGLKTPTFDEQTLRDWFARNRARYDQPPTYSFQEILPARNASDAAVQALVADLNAPVPKNLQPEPRVLTDRPRDELVRAYGEAFVVSLEASPKNEWRVLKSTMGPRLVRLDSVAPAVPADFEKVGGIVLQDWIDAMAAEQRSAAILAMEKRYVVEVIDGGSSGVSTTAPARDAE